MENKQILYLNVWNQNLELDLVTDFPDFKNRIKIAKSV